MKNGKRSATKDLTRSKNQYACTYDNQEFLWPDDGFGGVCLAIAREVPHRIGSEFRDIPNLIAADIFNSNKR